MRGFVLRPQGLCSVVGRYQRFVETQCFCAQVVHKHRHTSKMLTCPTFCVTITPPNFNCRSYIAVFCLRYSASRIINFLIPLIYFNIIIFLTYISRLVFPTRILYAAVYFLCMLHGSSTLHLSFLVTPKISKICQETCVLHPCYTNT